MTNSYNNALPALETVRIRDEFWGRTMDLVRNNVVPYQWEALNDRIEGAAKSHCIENFRIAAGQAEGEFFGCVFQDSDLGKWMEAAAYLLSQEPDPELEAICDEAVALMGAAQQADGYLNTYFTVKDPQGRWTNLKDWHELYCAGHLMEGAVAYYEATGKREFLDIMCRYADYIDSVFGPEEGKKHGYPGHEEIELALVKLYRATGERRYLNLAAYFINTRGTKPYYFDQEGEAREGEAYRQHIPGYGSNPGYEYYQAHKPVREQKDITGHAVRAMYLCTGMAEVARETGDESLMQACRTLFDSVVNRNMYVTGAIGSNESYERFSFDYHLPNDTVYGETCAAIGLVFFARSMLTLEKKAVYADVMERCLYNGVISGMSLDGKSFFYVNPLEVWPEAVAKVPNLYQHVALPRQKWFGCACCPPNLARLVASLGKYTYDYNGDTLYVHLYVGGAIDCGMVHMDVDSRLPWEGRVTFNLSAENEELDLALRIPAWCQGQFTITLNGKTLPSEIGEDGYAHIRRTWGEADEIAVEFAMPVLVLRSHPALRENVGKAALQRGPVVYCMEEADNGPKLHEFLLDPQAPVSFQYEAELLGGVGTLTCTGRRLVEKDAALYTAQAPETEPATAKLVPYYAWDNRGVGELMVWMHTL